MHKINATLDDRQADHQSTIVEVEGKIHTHNVSILIDPGASLSYITHPLVELNKIKKVNHAKLWLVLLATWTKIKVTYFISDYELSIDGQSTKSNMKILSLQSYDLIIGMDSLEKHEVRLNCYEKSFVYKDENNIVRTIQEINFFFYVRQISAMQFKKCMNKGFQIYDVQVTNLLR
jgi:hypothetical protein